MSIASTLYAAVARRRRERYSARPDLRKRLQHPVISVGNLAVGGRGKTPVAACIARLLLERGERPAILSRGYGRQQPLEGVVIVRDAERIRADVRTAGDEPFLLARQLPGVVVLVCEERYLAGRLAEQHLGATVHILDDGLQHLQVDRDVDIILVDAEDFQNPTTLPTGHLREPLDTLIVADAILAPPNVDVDLRGVDIPVFRTRRVLGEPSTESGACPGGSVFAVAGIASPDSFFRDLRAAGRTLSGTLAFPDHHPFSQRDLRRIMAAATAAGAACVLTTEKDYVRLEALRPFPVPIAWVPLTMVPEPLDEFTAWLARSLREARDIPGD